MYYEVRRVSLDDVACVWFANYVGEICPLASGVSQDLTTQVALTTRREDMAEKNGAPV